MEAVILACVAGCVFGLHGPLLRVGLRRAGDAEIGAFLCALVGLPVAVAVSGALGSLDEIDVGDIWPFFVIGMVVPGISQVTFVRAVRDIGPSRTMVITGVAPVCASAGGFLFLDEPFRFALLAGALLVMAGGAALAWEPARPESYRAVGIAWALAGVLMFASRDVLARWLAGGRDVPGADAAIALMAGAVLTMTAYLLVTRGRKLPGQVAKAGTAFVLAGLTFGGAYVLVFEALTRGKVTVVSPLNGTFALWGVAFSFLLVRRSEALTLKIAFAALLVVGGAALIGATR